MILRIYVGIALQAHRFRNLDAALVFIDDMWIYVQMFKISVCGIIPIYLHRIYRRILVAHVYKRR